LIYLLIDLSRLCTVVTSSFVTLAFFAMSMMTGCGSGSANTGSSSTAVALTPAPTPTPSNVLPTFSNTFSAGGVTYSYTMVGGNPQTGGTTTIPALVVPIVLVFDEFTDTSGNKLKLDPAGVLPSVTQSPIFQNYAFATGTTQYGDAVQRAAFWGSMQQNWHTRLGHR